MAFPLIPLALSLAGEFAPSVLRWIAGDTAGDVAEKVVSAAQAATGQGDAAAAAEALRANPEAVLRFQALMQGHEVALLEAETRQLEAINATMRSEAASKDTFVRRVRPTWGYVMAATWALQTLAVVVAVIWVVFATPTDGPSYIKAIAELMASLMPMWGVGLSVLGVYVWRRSTDKQTAAGHPPIGLGATISALTAGRVSWPNPDRDR